MQSNHRTQLAVLALSLAAAIAVEAQQSQRNAAASVIVNVDLKANGKPLPLSGTGSCTHAAQAAIYNVRSEMWMVRQQGDGGFTQLTLWRPVDGQPAMFNLSLGGAKDVNVSTVRGGKVSGGGTVTFKAAEKGGTFTVDAKTKDGEAITGTISCSSFAPAVAEGG